MEIKALLENKPNTGIRRSIAKTHNTHSQFQVLPDAAAAPSLSLHPNIENNQLNCCMKFCATSMI